VFTKNHYINIVSLLLLGIVSSLFMFKYSSRISSAPVLFTGLYLILFWFLALSLDKMNYKIKALSDKKLLAFFIIAASVVFIIGLNYIPIHEKVGRYVAMKSWLENFRYGFYPYSRNGNPTGFPGLFFIASPFYLLGDAGYLEVFGFFLFSLLILNYSATPKERITRFSLLLVLPSFYYEYLVRSELFTNMTLFIAIVLIAAKYLNTEKLDLISLAIAVLFGLFLSTRIIVFIVFFFMSVLAFRDKIGKGIVFMFVSTGVFALTLLPFIVWDPAFFWSEGPFSMQLLYLPLWIILCSPLVFLYIAWMIRDVQELFFASGVVIFTLVAISFLLKAAEYGFHFCLIESGYDISYFAMPVPFLLLSIKEYKVDRFLGKVLD
jgi:hypothetical protein